MFERVLYTVDKALTFFEEWTLFISVFVALIALFFNVVLRYTFNLGLPWSEELIRLVIIYTTFIGCCTAVKARTMIKIDASVQLLPKLKTPLTFFSNFVILIFSVMMIYYGILMCMLQLRTMQKTIIMQIPYVYLYAVLPLMGLLMLLRVIQVFYEDIKALRNKEATSS